ncbi:MAG: SNF2 helicase associated domain-containing protein [Clostridium sp.]
MNKELIVEIFNNNTTGNNGIKGRRILDNDLITNITTDTENQSLNIIGYVLSEANFNEYKSQIEIDLISKTILKCYCTCTDFDKNNIKKKSYCCKHLMAIFYYFLRTYEFNDTSDLPLSSLALSSINLNPKELLNSSENNILDILLSDFKDKKELKLEVYLNKVEYKNALSAEFRIGLKSHSSAKLYVLKDINQFLTYFHNKFPIKYGKDFTFDINNHSFNAKDSTLIDFIEDLKALDLNYSSSRNHEEFIHGKYIYPPTHLIKDFLVRIKDHRVYLNEGFYYRPVDCDILIADPPTDFALKLLPYNYELRLNSPLPESLNGRMDVLILGTTIYIPSKDYILKAKPYYKVFNGTDSILLPKKDEDKILRDLIPQLNSITPNLILSKNIREKIVTTSPNFSFYFNKENGDFSLTLKVKYNQYEFNIFDNYTDKIIYRDFNSENNIKSHLVSLGFTELNNKFYLTRGEDYIYNFFKNEICNLQELGEVFYSENFTCIKKLTSSGIMGHVSAGKYKYFELKFKLDNIDASETTNILRAFRDNLKYYKLKSGEFLDLEEIEVTNFLKLLDTLNDDNTIIDNIISFPQNKALYFDDFMDEHEIRYIKGKEELREVKTKFKSINNLKYNIPEDLNATLRPYQEVGFNWFKTLDHFGFGGILGDEMGLGKTIQTIAFLLSNKNSHSLIIAPTSLVYNWRREVEKFAPTLKIGIVNSEKVLRYDIIDNYKKYDLLITTYNLAKNDMEKYKEIEFDYIILDEAQNIKNPNSQNAISVKSLRSKCRFALTGTPIENSLLELWSIFDFIMPGYLYNQKKFNVRYNRKLKEGEEIIGELSKLIHPFILRRFKKDVARELPSKIEKRLEIELPIAQQKIYAIYAKQVMDFIEKKLHNDEFNKGKIEILAYITKLRQLCLDPSVVLENYIGTSGKIEALIELLHRSIDEGHKILVFSQFTSVLSNIKLRLNTENINYNYLDGSVPSEKRMNLVNDFNNDDTPVFLISLKAGGTGLNLTSADIVIHFDPWWNPAVEDQATDRSHRIGQKHVVEVIKLIAKDTIEEKIVSLQDEKRELISKLLGDELSTSEGLLSLSEDDIINLFQ